MSNDPKKNLAQSYSEAYAPMEDALLNLVIVATGIADTLKKVAADPEVAVALDDMWAAKNNLSFSARGVAASGENLGRLADVAYKSRGALMMALSKIPKEGQ